MGSINFVRDRRRKLSSIQVKDRVWLRRSLIALGVVTTILVIVGGAQLFLSRMVGQVQAQQTATKQQIVDREDTEKAFVISLRKLGLLTEIFQERQNKQQAIEYFSSVFGAQVLVLEIEYRAEEQLLTFRLQAQDVFVLEQVLERLKSDDVTSRFAGVKASDLQRTSQGNYEMTVAVTLGVSKKSDAKQ